MDSKWGVTAGLWAFAFAVCMNAQSAAKLEVHPARTDLAAASDFAPEVLRTIDDPETGNRWLVVRDPSRPAGPARAVLAEQRPHCSGVECARRMPIPERERPVIRAGDAITVEEHTSVLDVKLQAVALESSFKGGCLNARLVLGGKVESVMAVAPGYAAFVAESEVNACKSSPAK